VPDLFTYVGAAFRRGKAGSPLSRLTPTSRRVVRAWSLLTLIVLPVAVLFLLLALPALVVASWNSVETHVRALSHLEGAAAVATAVLGIAFTCIFMFAMAYGVVYITKRLVRAATNSAAARPHATQRAERINRRARASLVLCAIAVPVVWSATHVRIH
jgi:Na+-transporting methylmalonyl-CoA/oxaloacetate decarboxylase gamma subunit